MKIEPYKLCKRCNHTQDWHYTSLDLLYRLIFGTKFGKCCHYEKDYSLPIWKRKKIPCDCRVFEEANK